MFFGLNNVIAIAVMSFLLGAVISILLMISKTKKSSEYIPFGPFIVLSAIIAIFVPFEIIYNFLMTIFTLRNVSRKLMVIYSKFIGVGGTGE